MKVYTSTITVLWSGNNHECENKDEYKKIVKDQFKEEYGISLTDDEIKIDE
tara:strand:+ start:1049 stop:1201 length:153 start_codon:yes stop_codon:yes gene_type:complete